MTTRMNIGENDGAVLCSASDVEKYLCSHPEFFLDHPELLAGLDVPHSAGGAVSLIERQVVLIRQENKQHRERIRDLVEIARQNESIVKKLHQLTLQLMSSKTLDEYLENLQQHLREHFSANQVSVILFKEVFVDLESSVKLISRSDNDLANFEQFLTNKQPSCGRFSASQLTFLFGKTAEEVKSMALIPLEGVDSIIGMLAIGNASAAHFKADMSTSFLTSLGEVSSSVLTRLVNE